MRLKKTEQATNWILRLQPNRLHFNSQLLADSGRWIILAEQPPLLKRLANAGESIPFVNISKIANMDQVELAPHCQGHPQRMAKCIGAGVREIGRMDDGLKAICHGFEVVPVV
jgi:hypothetical protein